MMWNLRKALLVAAAILALFLLLRSSSSSSQSPQKAETQLESDSHRNSHHNDHSSQPGKLRAPASQEAFEPVTLLERLQYQFPYDIQSKFPAYIWQTWKVDPSSSLFEEHLRPFEASWTDKHPGFVHEVVTDENALYLIKYLYASVPEIVEAYESLPIPVLKADFFRYLILLARGGIYSDIDTQALKPAIQWLSEDFEKSTVGLVVGIEADPGDRADWEKWYSRRIQFCQWTIQSKPGHPVLLNAVAAITEEALRMKKAGVLKEGKMTKSIVEFTGPAVWSDVLLDYFNDRTFFDFSVRETNITWEDFTGMTQPKRVGDVIVLPITSFSPGVRQMGAGDYDDPMAFVRHAFGGSWKPPGEKDGNPQF